MLGSKEEGLGDDEVLGVFVGAGTLAPVFDDGLVAAGAETVCSVVLGGISTVRARSQPPSLSSFSKSTEIVLPGACTSNT